MLSPADRTRLIETRRGFHRKGFASYADVGIDGDYISPYHLTCGNPAGPVLISYNWLDAPSARQNRDTLRQTGYLPRMLFNRVLDRALALAQLSRAALYLTHAFHLLPATRSAGIPQPDLDASFDALTRFEIAGRPVIALGAAAARCCARFDITCTPVPHPSARGQTASAKARQIADALQKVTS